MPGSQLQSAEPVRRAAVVTHGRPEAIGDALARLAVLAADAGVEIATDESADPDLVTCDVSFISLRTALPPALGAASRRWQALPLVKPQFEAGRAEVKRGVVRDPAVHARVLRELAQAALGWNARVAGVVDSGLPGPKGNREFFLHLVHDERPTLPDDLDAWIAAAVG